LSEALGKTLFEQGKRRIAILGTQQIWEETQAKAVRKGFEAAGGQVVNYEIASLGETDFRLAALKIKEADPEAVVLTNYDNEDLGAKQLREAGVTIPFFSILLDDDRIKAGEGAFEGTVVTTSFTPSDEFKTKFVATYQSQPDIGTDTSYDAVMLIASAIEATDSTDPTVLKEYINSLETYSGVSGELTFDGKGGVSKESQFMVVKNNELVLMG